jgi:YjbR protein
MDMGMTVKDFRRIALSLDGAEEGSHMGAVDFRVGGRIFATLAAVKKGYGNLLLTPEHQASFVEEMPDVFLPVPGGWGRNGATHVLLANATEEVVEGALRTAHRLRVEMNAKTKANRESGAKTRTGLGGGVKK